MSAPRRPPPRRPSLEEQLALIDVPPTIAAWKATAQGLLSDECCAFHRNMEISSRYAELYRHRPQSLKWAAMAAIASHHVRLALFPLHLDSDGSGYVDIPRHLRRHRTRLADDVNTIRKTNNAIFDDIYWVHLAYVTSDDGIERLRSLVREDRHYAAMLAGFEAIERGCPAPADAEAPAARNGAEDLVWAGNLQLLRHEQRAVVQPNFDLLSCASAWLLSIGSASSFEVRETRRQMACFTSFYLYSLGRDRPDLRRRRGWPRLTRFDDRWRWLEGSVVPQFRKLDAAAGLVDDGLRRIIDDARTFASIPCVLPLAPSDR